MRGRLDRPNAIDSRAEADNGLARTCGCCRVYIYTRFLDIPPGCTCVFRAWVFFFYEELAVFGGTDAWKEYLLAASVLLFLEDDRAAVNYGSGRVD